MQRFVERFRMACEFVRNGRIGKIKHGRRRRRRPAATRATCRRRRRSRGLDWDLWLGPAPSAPTTPVLSPRGVHKHFPAWRNYREYAGGMMTDWGAHHFDIAQWGLGMDDSGPVEIIPPDGKEVKHSPTYANGVVMITAA